MKPEKIHKYAIDGNNFETSNPIVKGSDLRSQGKVPADYEVYLEVNGPGDDELIGSDQEVDISQPGKEKFYSSKPTTNNG